MRREKRPWFPSPRRTVSTLVVRAVRVNITEHAFVPAPLSNQYARAGTFKVTGDGEGRWCDFLRLTDEGTTARTGKALSSHRRGRHTPGLEPQFEVLESELRDQPAGGGPGARGRAEAAWLLSWLHVGINGVLHWACT